MDKEAPGGRLDERARPVDWGDVRRRAFALADMEVSRDPDSLEARGAREYLRAYFAGIFSDAFRTFLLDAVSEANPRLSGGSLDAALAEVAARQARSHFRADMDLGLDRFADVACGFEDIDPAVGDLPQAMERQRLAISDALGGSPVARMRTPEGDLVVRETGDGEGYRGFAVDLEGPDGSGGRVSWTEVVSGQARGAYPTPVHTFAWDGRDEDAARVDCDPAGPFMHEGAPAPSAQEAFERSLSASAASAAGASPARTRSI